MQYCEHCENGIVLPKYRKNRAPTYRCNHCRRPYVPKPARDCQEQKDETIQAMEAVMVKIGDPLNVPAGDVPALEVSGRDKIFEVYHVGPSREASN